MRISIFLLIVASVIGCNHSGDSFGPNSDIQGAWLLYEKGYSPGSGYVINPVSEDPPRTIVFSGEQQFSSTLENLVDYKFYSITKDTQSETWELWLYKAEPDPSKDPEPSRLMYNFEFEGDRLKLYPAFPTRCIEGCHIGFKR